ncbi:MAG: catalase [Candidatus Tectomicrobia bacterium]|uniref:Catalase n=1 Tax=Tectimicrobiota bacterium TaxID=2528274 RepID=A0A937W1S9_UNCTE|nr:catalase [Candidatus Tectomicrobia bacterium]
MVTALVGVNGSSGNSHLLRVVSPAVAQTPSPQAVDTDDRVQLSTAGRERAATAAEAGGNTPADAAETPFASPAAAAELDPAVQQTLEALRQRDQEVRQHEQAHLLAAGPYAKGGARYSYETGPDGHRYAVGGEVPIDLSEVAGDPQATLQKALTIQRAALAPQEPSATDQAVAAKASALAARAQQELLQAQAQERAAHTKAGGASEAVSGPATTAAARHACGANCQNHGTTPPLAVSAPSAAPPLASGARAIAQYQTASTGAASLSTR